MPPERPGGGLAPAPQPTPQDRSSWVPPAPGHRSLTARPRGPCSRGGTQALVPGESCLWQLVMRRPSLEQRLSRGVRAQSSEQGPECFVPSAPCPLRTGRPRHVCPRVGLGRSASPPGAPPRRPNGLPWPPPSPLPRAGVHARAQRVWSALWRARPPAADAGTQSGPLSFGVSLGRARAGLRLGGRGGNGSQRGPRRGALPRAHPALLSGRRARHCLLAEAKGEPGASTGRPAARPRGTSSASVLVAVPAAAP